MNITAVVSHVRTMGRIETSPHFLPIIEQRSSACLAMAIECNMQCLQARAAGRRAS
jgi:hypothetical protein